MNYFDVLNHQFSIQQRCLVEASAGTGKTFSIQNIVARLLIEESSLTLPQILIVTFTRAATCELKTRIQMHLEQLQQLFKQWIKQQAPPENLPSYLLPLAQKEIKEVKKTVKKISQALFLFEQAQIFTIHAFCARALRQFPMESKFSLGAAGEEDGPVVSETLAMVNNFFRTEIRYQNYSPSQIDRYLKLDNDQKKIAAYAHHALDIISLPDFHQSYLQFCQAMQTLCQDICSEKLLNDFLVQAPFYKNHSRESKTEIQKKITFFTSLFAHTSWSFDDFDRLLEDDLVWVHALDPSLLKKKTPSLKLNYPHFTEQIRIALLPIIQTAINPSYLFARLTKDFKSFLRHFKDQEEKFSPDDFLQQMHLALKQPCFTKSIQEKYRAVVIDEFQDTDPLQWQIFYQLFAKQKNGWDGYLYLVGDPKQSISSFRQADIYTYLNAKQAIGKAHCFSLDVNYRSHASLIKALNTLFDSKQVNSLFPLPKIDSELTYQPVKANSTSSILKEDGKGAIHFIAAQALKDSQFKSDELEIELFFPYITEEIIKMRLKNQLKFSQFAILVRDKHQATRLADYFTRHGLPYHNQKQSSLADSPMLTALIDLLRAIISPKDRSLLKVSLGSQLMGWNSEQIQNEEEIEKLLPLLYPLRRLLFEKEFAYFSQVLLDSCWPPQNRSLKQMILEREGGLQNLHDLEQLFDLVIEQQKETPSRPEEVVLFLDHICQWEEEDKRLKKNCDAAQEGIKILTLHYSKGLEFDIVFTLGLLNRKKPQELLIPYQQDSSSILIPKAANPGALEQFYQESDAEKMRQLYVAFTRAKYRLYVPLAKNFKSSLKKGEAAPLDLFLARFKKKSSSYEELYRYICEEPEKDLFAFIDKHGQDSFISYSTHSVGEFVKSVTPSKKEIPLLQKPTSLHFCHPNLQITSFSTLSRFLGKTAKEEEEPLQAPQDYLQPIKELHLLPANKETGSLIHQLLEKVNFSLVEKMNHAEELIPFIELYLKQTYLQGWEKAVAKLVFNGLKTAFIHESFCLAKLKPANYYREMSFLYPFDQKMAIEEISYSQGMIKGVIDLVFSYENRYYIVDWKTNWLGDHFKAYDLKKMKQSMDYHHYSLQANLYKEALRRYLAIIDPRPFAECYGGAFYLYLRGMQPGFTTGIYNHL